MRNLFLLTIALATALTISCSKDEIDDYTNPENLSGTSWKCSSVNTWDESLEYALLVFTSKTTVEGWTKTTDQAVQKDWTGSFTISNDRISISFEDDSITGTIEAEKMNLTIDGELFIFYKE